jgi:hypothetical protein
LRSFYDNSRRARFPQVANPDLSRALDLGWHNKTLRPYRFGDEIAPGEVMQDTLDCLRIF